MKIVNSQKCQFDGPGRASYHEALRIIGLKLGEIAKELSSGYGPDGHTPPSRKYWLHQIMLGRTDLRMQHLGG
jgi:hypothetical protein